MEHNEEIRGVGTKKTSVIARPFTKACKIHWLNEEFRTGALLI